MKLHWGVLVLLVLLLSAPVDLPNKSDFWFSMEHRVVHGRKNQVIHKLNPGILTVSGSLWVTAVVPRSVGPSDVSIEVYRLEEGFFAKDRKLCEIAVAPSKTIGRRVSFSGSCGSVSGSLYVVAWKSDDDGAMMGRTFVLRAQ